MDRSASILARLKNKSIKSGKPLQLHLQLFCQEEFLRRVSLSRYSENLVLKGGMFIYTLTNFESRATVDIDFLLRQLPNSIGDLKLIVDDILSADTGNDFIKLAASSFDLISPHRRYSGISCQLIGQISNTKTPFNVDFGVGDIIVPGALKHEFPVQLDDFSTPIIMSYSLESTIAEKLDALLQRLELTSRMKDIYDIYYLLLSYNFNGPILRKAVYETLTNRGTPYAGDSFDRLIALAGNKEIQLRWRQYLIRTKLPKVELSNVLNSIDSFLRPIWISLDTGNPFTADWNHTREVWYASESS